MTTGIYFSGNVRKLQRPKNLIDFWKLKKIKNVYFPRSVHFPTQRKLCFWNVRTSHQCTPGLGVRGVLGAALWWSYGSEASNHNTCMTMFAKTHCITVHGFSDIKKVLVVMRAQATTMSPTHWTKAGIPNQGFMHS